MLAPRVRPQMRDFLCRALSNRRLLISMMTVMRGGVEAHTPSLSALLPNCANQAAEELPFVSKRRVASVAGPTSRRHLALAQVDSDEAVGAYVERIERTVPAHSRLLADAAGAFHHANRDELSRSGAVLVNGGFQILKGILRIRS